MRTAHPLIDLLGLETPPVAVRFRESAPAGLRRVGAAGPSGCSYWKLAAEGHAFYTEAADHFNCPIGAYTHGVALPPEKGRELEELVGTMVDLSYIRMEEVSSIPRREEAFGVAIYERLAEAREEPDVVIVRGNARQVMLLNEAAQAAGAASESGMMGRPTCAALSAAMRSGGGVASLGCIGNRVYTGLAEDEIYYVLPGNRLQAVLDRLETVVRANETLEGFHRERMAAVGEPRV